MHRIIIFAAITVGFCVSGFACVNFPFWFKLFPLSNSINNGFRFSKRHDLINKVLEGF